MRPFAVAAVLLLASSAELFGRTYHEVRELDAVFDRHLVTGTFVLFDPAMDRMEISNKLRAQRRFSSATSALPLGPTSISAIEQTELLARLLDAKGAVGENNLRAIRQATLVERTPAGRIYAQTGSVAAAKRRIGWWIGWVERDGKTFPFALNIDMFKDEDAEKRAQLGRECLKALGKL